MYNSIWITIGNDLTSFVVSAHDQIFMMDKLASNQVHLEKATSMAIDDLSENHLKLIGQQQEMAKIADIHRYVVCYSIKDTKLTMHRKH